MQACEMALNGNVGTWPESFFRAELNQNDMRIRTKQSILLFALDITDKGLGWS